MPWCTCGGQSSLSTFTWVSGFNESQGLHSKRLYPFSHPTNPPWWSVSPSTFLSLDKAVPIAMKPLLRSIHHAPLAAIPLLHMPRVYLPPYHRDNKQSSMLLKQSSCFCNKKVLEHSVVCLSAAGGGWCSQAAEMGEKSYQVSHLGLIVLRKKSTLQTNTVIRGGSCAGASGVLTRAEQQSLGCSL